MGNRMSPTQFWNLVALNCSKNVTSKTCQEVFYAIYDSILQNLEIGNEVNLESFGIFKMITTKAQDKKIGNFEKGGSRLVYCPEKNKVIFSMSKRLLESINDDFKRREIKYKPKSTRKHKNQKLKEWEEKRKLRTNKPKLSNEELFAMAINRASDRKNGTLNPDLKNERTCKINGEANVRDKEDN